MVYFVMVPPGLIKIGTTITLDRRLRHIRYRYGEPSILLATRDGSYDEERALHRRFARHRCRKTELFQPHTEILDFLGIQPSEIANLYPTAGDGAAKPAAGKVARSIQFSKETLRQCALLARAWGTIEPLQAHDVVAEAISRAFHGEGLADLVEDEEEDVPPLCYSNRRRGRPKKRVV